MNTLFKDYTIKKKLGIIVKANRKINNITQDELANKINCDQSVISRIELGNDNVDISIYKSALEYLNLQYNEDSDLNSLNELFDKIFKMYEYSQYDKLLVLEDEINKMIIKNNDIIKEYHCGVIIYFYYYNKKDYSKCDEVDEYLKDVISVCSFKFQLLYLITKVLTSIFTNRLDGTKEIVDVLINLNGKETKMYKPFLNYIIGCYYFKINNRSLSLKYFIECNEYFTETKNYVRIFLLKMLVNSFLLKERNFNMAIGRYKKILEISEFLTKEFIHQIYFYIGYSFFSMKQYDEAIINFNKALEINCNNDVNHSYYYLLNIYDDLDDLSNFKIILSKINYENKNNFGNKIINLYLQSRMHKSKKYYELIEKEILPIIDQHYEKMEIIPFLLELLNFYYDNQQYAKYHDLAKIIYTNLA